MEEKKVLLVGGAGTLGSDILASNMKEVNFHVVDDFSDSVLSRELVIKNATLSEFNIAEIEPTKLLMESFKPDAVIYLATNLTNDSRKAFDANVLGLSNIIQTSEEGIKPHIIYLQSFLTRKTESPINERTQISAADSYSTWKLAGELLLNSYSGPKTNLILGSVISPRISVGAIPAFSKRLTDNQVIKVTGTSRDYLNPQDFISAITHVLASAAGLGTITVGSGKAIPTVEILLLVSKFLAIDSPKFEMIEPNPSDPVSIILDSSNFKEKFLWFPSCDFEESVSRAVSTFLSSNNSVRLHH